MDQSHCVPANTVLNVERLWREHAHFVYRLCLRFTRDKDLAEDLRQDVFLKIMAKSQEYKGSAEVRSWIYSIARNSCMDFFRRERRGKLSVMAPDQFDALQWSGCLQVAEPVPCSWDCERTLQECTPLGRTMLELHFCEGLAHSEIAVLMGISRTAVGKKIHHALGHIKKRGAP